MTAVNEYTIRKATEADIDWLVDFNCCIAKETEDKTLDRERVTRGVTRGLQQGGEVTYFVAESNSEAIGPQPVGCLMLTREWSDWRDGWLVWIQSVYVVAEHRGVGVFRSLLEYATQFVRADKDVVGLRLYVEEENVRAQSVYQRTGFKDPNYKVLEKLF